MQHETKAERRDHRHADTALSRPRSLARVVLLGLVLASLAGCGEAAEALPGSGAGGSGAGGSGGSGGAGGGEPVYDPLDLSRCDAPIGPLAEPVGLPGLAWEDGDDHPAHCAFRALDSALEGKRIICSGENDHGVSETMRWHAALARYLVHQWGVRVIALELDAASVAHWNRYLTSGDPEDLAAGFADSSGTLADSLDAEGFVESLRAVQAELPAGERIRLTGYDVAVARGTTIEALLEFLDRVDPAGVEAWAATWNSRDYAEAAAQTDLLVARIEEQRDAWVAATDEESWLAARTNAANLRDGLLFIDRYMRGDFGGGNADFREPGMIRNVEDFAAALEGEERLLLIGHNLHCTKSTPASGASSISQSPALGTHLAMSETWGPQYFMLAQLYQRGRHNVLGRTGIEAMAFDSGSASLAGALEPLTDAPALLIGTNAATPRMDDFHNLKAFGTTSYQLVPAAQFDGILWVREVSETELR